jgi:hypothetical protein
MKLSLLHSQHVSAQRAILRRYTNTNPKSTELFSKVIPYYEVNLVSCGKYSAKYYIGPLPLSMNEIL